MRDTMRHTAALMLILAAAVWLFQRLHPWPDTPDGLLHLHRVRALGEAWQQGILYPRWFPDFAFGYGHPILNFYSPAYYPVAAFFNTLGLDLLLANRLALALFFALSGVACYALLRRWAGFWPALAGVALFLFFPYRLYDLFVRGALPEFAAFLWSPLLLYGYDRLLRPTSAASRFAIPRPGGLLFTGLAWAGLILTHNLTALMAGLAWALLSAAMLLRAWWKPSSPTMPLPARMLLLTAPLALGGLLSGFYIAPVLLEAHWVGIGAGDASAGYATHAVTWAALWSKRLAAYAYSTAADPTVALPAYVALLSLTPWARAYRARLWGALGITLISLWLTTTASLPLWDLTSPILGKLQFPWRWHTLLSLSVAVTTSLALHTLINLVRHSRVTRRVPMVQAAAALLALYFVVHGAAALPANPAPFQAHEPTRAHMWAFDAQHGQVGATWTGEFLPRWVTAPRWTIGRGPDPDSAPAGQLPATPGELPDPAETALVVRPIHLAYELAVYAIQTPHPISLSLPHFYYPAWRATLGGTPVDLYPDGDLGWLTLHIPAGDHMLMLMWGATPAVHIGRVLTVTGWLAAGLLLWRIQRHTGPPPFGRLRRAVSWGSWAAAALLALLAMTNALVWTGVGIRSPQPQDHDYGYVHLSAAELPTTVELSTIPEAPAEIILHWTVRHAPAPLHAFVHLIDAGGTLITQYDAPIGGDYLPVARFQPGLPVTSRHPLSLPPATPPGVYTLLAGVYFAYAAADPLSTEDAATPRGEIGHLEVQR